MEFGAVASVFFALLLAITDLGRFFMTRHSLNLVLGEVTRAAMIDSSLSGCTAPAAKVLDKAPFLNGSTLTLCVDRQVSGGMTTLTVTATYPFTFFLPVWVGSSMTLSDRTTATYASVAN